MALCCITTSYLPNLIMDPNNTLLTSLGFPSSLHTSIYIANFLVILTTITKTRPILISKRKGKSQLPLWTQWLRTLTQPHKHHHRRLKRHLGHPIEGWKQPPLLVWFRCEAKFSPELLRKGSRTSAFQITSLTRKGLLRYPLIARNKNPLVSLSNN